MKAQEARQISQKREIKLEEIFERIKQVSEGGGRYISLCEFISPVRAAEIMAEGYKVSTFTDHIGMDYTKIEW